MEKLHHRGIEDVEGERTTRTAPDPGRLPATARIARGSVSTTTNNYVLRVESAEAARELAGMFGPRDGNGVAAGADAAVERAADAAGSPLPGELRGRFERSLGADLSSVRVHTGAESQAAARAVGAKAYTVGQDIHFGEGYWDPSSSAGMFLVAHEVAHTVQQAGGALTRQHKLEVSTPGDAAEVEADRAAAAMVAGEASQVGAGTMVIARDGFDDGDVPERIPGPPYPVVPHTEKESPQLEKAKATPPPLNWGAVAPNTSAPAAAWSGAPTFEDPYHEHSIYAPFRSAFEGSWATALSSYNALYHMNKVVQDKEGPISVMLNVVAFRKLEAPIAGKDAKEAFEGKALKEEVTDIESKHMKEKTRADIKRLTGVELIRKQNAVNNAVIDVGTTNLQVENAESAVGRAKNKLTNTKSEAELLELGLTKDQVQRDLDARKAELDSMLQSAKMATSAAKALFDPDPKAKVGNVIALIEQGATLGASVMSTQAIKAANGKLAAIDAEVAKVSASKAGLAAVDAKEEIDEAKNNVLIAKNEVQKAVNNRGTAVAELNAHYDELAKVMGEAAVENGMVAEDVQLLKAAVEARPQIAEIIDLCTGMIGNVSSPSYSENSGVGAAMSPQGGEFQQKVAVVKGGNEQLGAIKSFWEARLASVDAVIANAAAMPASD